MILAEERPAWPEPTEQEVEARRVALLRWLLEGYEDDVQKGGDGNGRKVA